MDKATTLTAIIERNDDGYWARIETIPEFLVTGYRETMEELNLSLREALTDYLENEGKDNPDFATMTAKDFELIFKHDFSDIF